VDSYRKLYYSAIAGPDEVAEQVGGEASFPRTCRFLHFF